MFTIIDFSIVYIIGAAALTLSAISEQMWLAFIGLVLIAIGTGGIKPCVAAFGAQQLMDPSYNPPTGWTTQHLVSIFFSSFYLSINLGSLFAYLLLPLARRYGGFEAAFGAATIVLALSLVVFVLPCRKYLRERPKGSILASILAVIAAGCSEQCRTRGTFWWLSCCSSSGSSVVHGDEPDGLMSAVKRTVAGEEPPTPSALLDDGEDHASALDRSEALTGGSEDAESASMVASPASAKPSPRAGGSAAAHGEPEKDEAAAVAEAARVRSMALRERAGCLNAVRGKFSDEMVDGAASITAILPVFSIIALFWALYDQQGNTWVLQAKRMDLGPFEPDQLGAINPLLVMVMLPVYRAAILPCLECLGRRCPILEPTPLKRMGVGMLLASFTFLLSAAVEFVIDSSPPKSVSVLLQLPQWVLITIAEIFLSVTGLEWAYTQADRNLQGVCMAAWFFSNGLGDIIGGLLYQATKSLSQTAIYLMFAALMVVAFGVYAVIAIGYKSVPPEPVARRALGGDEEAQALVEDGPYDALAGIPREDSRPASRGSLGTKYGAAADDASVGDVSLAPALGRREE